MGCCSSSPADDGTLTPAASNPLVKGGVGYGATGAGAGAGAGAGGAGGGDEVGTLVPMGQDSVAPAGVSGARGRFVWVGASTGGSGRRHGGHGLLYRVLSVYVSSAADLIKGDVLSSDPFCNVVYQNKALNTKVLKNTLNPEWRQWLHFVGVEAGGPWHSYGVRVYDHDTVSAHDLLGVANVEVREQDRKQAPVPRWLPLAETSSGQINVTTVAHKYAVVTVTLQRVTIISSELGPTKQIAVRIRQASRQLEYDWAKCKSISTAVWGTSQKFWACVDRDAACVVEVLTRDESDPAGATVLGSCQFLAREYVSSKTQEMALPLHRGPAGGFGAMAAQLEVSVGQVVIDIRVDGGGSGGSAVEAHVPSLISHVHHDCAALAAVQAPQAVPTIPPFYPEWTTPGEGEETKRELSPAKTRLLAAMEAAGQCADCGSNQPLPSWVNTQFGTFICSRCSGVHRAVGTEYDFVQNALYDDSYWTTEHVAAFEARQAAAATTGYLEHCCGPDATPDERSRAIRTKYGFPDPDSVVGLDAGKVQRLDTRGWISVTVVSATDLVNADTLSKSDPYIVVSLGSNRPGRTTTKDNTLNPEWGERLLPFNWNGVDQLCLRVMDADVVWDDFLGEAAVVLDGIPSAAQQIVTVPLHGVASGSVTLAISYRDLSAMAAAV